MVLGSGPQSTADLCVLLQIKKPESVRIHYLVKAIEIGLIELTQPDSPRSPTQKYRLTEKGRALLKELVQE